MSATCRDCGRVNAEGAEFCANPDCGAFLGWEGRPDQEAGARAQAAGGPVPGGQGPAGGDQRVGVRATLADPAVAVDPGTSSSTTVSVYNSGTQVEGFTITLSGPAAAWGAVEPPEISVYPEQTATVTLRFTPPRAPSSAAGHAWYVVRLDSTIHPGVVVTANGAAAVGAYHEVSAELAPATSTGRRTTRHHIVAHNRGNVVEHARLAASDDEGVFRIDLDRATVDLPPGQTRVPLKVKAPWRWFGRRRTVPIHATLDVEGAGAPVRADGSRHVVPVFPSWAPVALAAVLALAGGGTAALMAFRAHKPPPQTPIAAAATSSATTTTLSPTPTTPSPTQTTPSPIPTTPSPTQTTPSPPGPIAAASATVAVSPASYSGFTCPAKFMFSGVIHVSSGPVAVTYKWIRSNGTSTPGRTIDFTGSGAQSQNVAPDTWTIGANGSHWEAIQILSPGSSRSSQATFTLNCQLHANAIVSPASYSGPDCPPKFTFTGAIRVANGPVSVTYRWIRSDGAAAPQYTINFTGSGAQSQNVIPDTWTVGANGSHWEAIQILSPGSVRSNKATFTLNCQ